MNASMWKAIAVMLCSGLLGASVAFAFARAEPAPPPHTKPTDADWLPKEGQDPRVAPALSKDRPERIDFSSHPTAFPDLREPDTYMKSELREKHLENLCPRLHRLTEIAIEPTDDIQRKLLKARIHQAIYELYRVQNVIQISSWNTWYLRRSLFSCLTDIRTAATELWAAQPKELLPWLEECVVMAKEIERYSLRRVVNGIDPPHAIQHVRRYRLKAEAELWKAKNPK